MRGQGATEYLVLLAVVLIIALVAIALLGFFPGLSSGITEEQSRAYWSSASPISITEWGAKYLAGNNTAPYLRVTNTGAYPLRITKIIGQGNASVDSLIMQLEHPPPMIPISELYYLAPGESKYFGSIVSYPDLPDDRDLLFSYPDCDRCIHMSHVLAAASSVCPSDGQGNAVVPGFGFEYIAYAEGQAITKQEVGTVPLTIKCG